MAENIGYSPADAKTRELNRGNHARKEPSAARSDAKGISTSPSDAKKYRTDAAGKCEPAKASDGSGQDKSQKYSIKPDLRSRG